MHGAKSRSARTGAYVLYVRMRGERDDKARRKKRPAPMPASRQISFQYTRTFTDFFRSSLKDAR